MNYQKHYNKLIENCKSRNRTKLKRDHKDYIYYENHHIIPKCLGGSNKKDNLVLLIPEEHIIAHLLLRKIYPKSKSLRYAVYCMTNGFNSCSIKNNKKYSKLKKEHNEFLIKSGATKIRAEKAAKTTIARGSLKGKNHPLFGIGHSAESKLKISLNHHDVSGSNNPRAKTYKIISPTNEIYYITGGLKKFCNKHNFNYSTAKKYINKGKIFSYKLTTTIEGKNIIGWTIIN